MHDWQPELPYARMNCAIIMYVNYIAFNSLALQRPLYAHEISLNVPLIKDKMPLTTSTPATPFTSMGYLESRHGYVIISII